MDNYLTAIGQTVKAVVYGLGLSALVQGVLAGLGYWVAGVGAPIFLAALTTIVRHHPLRRADAVGRRRRCGSSSPGTPWRGWAC